MLQFREVPAAEVRAGDLLLLCHHEPPLTRRVRAVARGDGQMVLTMDGLPAGTPPWRAQPHVTMRVVDETGLEIDAPRPARDRDLGLER